MQITFCAWKSTKVLGRKFNKCEIGADIIAWLAVQVGILNIQYYCFKKKKKVGRKATGCWLPICICQKLLSQFRSNAHKITSWIFSDWANWFPKLSLNRTTFYISSTICNNTISWILKLRLYYITTFNLLLYLLLPSSSFPSDLYIFIEILFLF